MDDMMTQLIYPALTLSGLGLLFGALLAWAARIFAVEVDEKVEAIQEVLPGANCGACGLAGCANFAELVVSGGAAMNACIPGGKELVDNIASILGQDAMDTVPLTAVVFCVGDNEAARDDFVYDGPKDCRLANTLWDGFKACRYGCLGLGTCVQSCLFDAITMGENNLPVIDEEACTGCGMCKEICPRDVIKIIPKEYGGCLLYCNSKDRGKKVKEACTVGCISCKACEKACPHGAVKMVNNLPEFDLDKCINCGECIIKCRQKGIQSRSDTVQPAAKKEEAAV